MSWRRKHSPSAEGTFSDYQDTMPFRNDQEFGSTSTTESSSIETRIPDDICTTKPDGWGTRHTLTVFGFFGFMVSYAMRVNLSMAIVAMVMTNSSSSSEVNISNACPSLLLDSINHPFSSSPESSGEFDWSTKDQGIILGAFFWGYVILQVPGGMLAERIGGKWPFGIGMLVTAIFSLLTPLAARTGKNVLIICRIIQGLGEGVTNPAAHALMARWLPPLERSRLGGFIYIGAQAGTVITMPLCGYLISSNFLGGWPSVFYIMGTLGIIWFIFWSFFVFDSPKDHPRIEAKELSYIQHSIGLQMSQHKKVPTPWRKMLTSMPVIAILIAQTGHGWGLYTLLTELPTYLKTILHFDMKSNGYLSAVPYLAMVLFSLASTVIADNLREKNVFSNTIVRKIFLSIAHLGAASFLIGAAYSGCDRLLAVTLITLSIGVMGAFNASVQMNHIDIASNHAGVMMGVTNGFANLMGIAAPYAAGVIISDNSSLSNWRLIFLIAAAIFTADTIFYLIFGSGEEQVWNRESKPKEISNIRVDSRNGDLDDRQPLLAEANSD